MNIIIDKPALIELQKELKQFEKDSVRIFVSTMRCSGPSLSLAFYNKKDEDKIINSDGINFYLENGIEEFGEAINISKSEGFGGGYSVELSNIDLNSCPV